MSAALGFRRNNGHHHLLAFFPRARRSRAWLLSTSSAPQGFRDSRWSQPQMRPRRLVSTISTVGAQKEPLDRVDETIYNLIQKEQESERLLINLVPSANYTSRSVLAALGSEMQNPNSEGYLGSRYFPGTPHMDDGERLCQERALQAFRLADIAWAVNVQSHSRDLATLQAYSAMLAPHGRLLALELPQGSCIAKYFTAVSLDQRHTSPSVDYEALANLADSYRPRVISASATKLPDYRAIAAISRKIGAYLVVDMTDTSGHVAVSLAASPFEFADVVLTGTQGSLRGRSGALIFSRKGVRVTRIDTKDDAAAATSQTWDLDHAIEASVFPRHQGGPHNHSMIAMAVAMRQARTPEFRLYQSRVLANAAALEERLRGLGCDLARGGGDDGKGTKSHQVVVGVSSSGELRAAKRVLGKVGIACGVDTGRNELRFGSYAMTTRGLLPTDFHCVADIVHHALALSTHAGKADDVESAPDGGTPLGNSQDDSMDDRFGEGATGILEMRKEVEEWMFTFTVPWD